MLKVTSIGNSMGIILPKKALGKMKVAKGDSLTPYQEDLDQQIEIAEKVMNKYRNALHELAK